MLITYATLLTRLILYRDKEAGGDLVPKPVGHLFVQPNLKEKKTNWRSG